MSISQCVFCLQTSHESLVIETGNHTQSLLQFTSQQLRFFPYLHILTDRISQPYKYI